MALKGIKVLEFVGLAPGPFCGKILSDFGATVTRIDKLPENSLDTLQHGKRTLAVNLKDPKGQELIRQYIVASKCDVLIEPFRSGVMEKLNLGPEVLCKLQPSLIYARLTGFGQTGRLAPRAGHDINYAAISGVLSMLGRYEEKPTAPINIVADFAGGGLMCALGILVALLERHRSGQGQVVDASMVEGAAYVSSWLFTRDSLPVFSKERGRNMLDGGAFFYDTYQTKDGKFMCVGALEPQFFELFKENLGLPHLTQFVSDEEQTQVKDEVTAAFLTKTQAEWSKIFEDIDACVYPVLDWNEAHKHDHNADRGSFQRLSDGSLMPRPAPLLSRTPGKIKEQNNNNNRNAIEDLKEILQELNLKENAIKKLINDKIIMLPEGEGSKAKL